MTPSARYECAIALLTAMDATPRRPADAVANAFFRERRYIGGGDRRAVSGIVWDVLRGWRRLEWHLAQVNAAFTPRLRVATMLLFAGQEFGAIAQSFVEGRFAPGALDSDERRALQAITTRNDGKPTLDDAAQPRAVRLEVPDWLLAPLEARFGADLEAELAAMGGEATLDLRVNTLVADRDAAREALRREGFAPEPTSLSPWGLRLAGRQPVTSSAAFQSGLVEIQDEGSQLVAAMLAPAPEMRVLDYCAGAGGKTLALAMMMQNRGHIVACDVSEARLEGAVRRLRRAGVHNAERHLLAAGDKWAKRRAGTFDRVLVDAPCTGTGTWRRNPDARMRLTPQDLAELNAKQSEILDRAAALVRPGGRMVYATCSVLDAENIDQVTAFLARRPEFSLVPPGGDVLPPALAAEAVLSLSPHRDGTDGFFAAVMERAAAGIAAA